MHQNDLQNKDVEWPVSVEIGSRVLVVAVLCAQKLVRLQQHYLIQVRSAGIYGPVNTNEKSHRTYYICVSGSRADKVIVRWLHKPKISAPFVKPCETYISGLTY